MTSLNKGIDKSRIVFEIPDFNWFGQLLHERLHAVLYHVEEIESKFMLITNLYDRDSARIQMIREKNIEDVEALLYSGVDRQRLILENENEPLFYIKSRNGVWDRDTWRKERDLNWRALTNRQLTRDMKKVETFHFFDQFRDGKLDISSIKTGDLKSYFAELDNVLKEHEFPIISDFFDIVADKYIGIPLMGMGLFQGIVWIVFKAEEAERFDYKTVKRLVKIFQMEYDSLVLSWDVTGVNMRRKSIVKQAIKEVDKTNPIQEACNFFKYYEISDFYHDKRVKQNDDVVDKIKEQFLKTAIITILLDSFAHNISAHSLTTLSWWFRERSEYLGEGKVDINALGRGDLNPLIKYTRVKNGGTLSRELYPLFKFLLEKGAFWSGITRRTNFTGKTSSFYNVLWYDFVNNPLYLGTIANTEEVRKLHIKITIYENEYRVSGENFKNYKVIKKNAEGVLLDGIFATINLDDFEKNIGADSMFVEEGPIFKALKAELEHTKAFFPGGVVGKHAFFTLLENEIRNVKHFKGPILEKIQEKGLTLSISIHERPVDSLDNVQMENPQLLKIGVWLDHPVDIKASLLVRRIDGLDAPIVTEDTFQPKLGGILQDKICAAMLLTNSFDKVQDDESSIGNTYYPWIKTASCKIREQKDNLVTEFEVSQRRYEKLSEQPEGTFEKQFEPESGLGYLKKYFHLWKGADVFSLDEIPDIKPTAQETNPEPNTSQLLPFENSARFRFLHLHQDLVQHWPKFKSEGIIRILQGNTAPQNIEQAYQQWLPNWIKTQQGSKDTVIDFWEDDTIVGRFTYENHVLRFENMQQVADVDWVPEKHKTYLKIPNRSTIAVEHGSKLTAKNDKFNYRTTGDLISRFCKGKFMGDIASMDAEDMYDLFEALCTRICVFDRRIFNRMYMGHSRDTQNESAETKAKRQLQKERLDLYRKELHLDFRSESYSDWNALKEQGFLKQHFLIIHLSFIEGMEDKNGSPYTEYRIIEFIDEQILQGNSPDSIGDDFILVITTGRGRMAWWDKLKEKPEYTRFTTFRPIESILGAVEDALQLPDDINLKYNLTKLLFGS